MKKILVLGAGFSSPYLIRYLLDHAAELEASVTVADYDADAAAERVGGHERGEAIGFDISDDDACRQQFSSADLVVNLLPPKFQPLVAEHCVAYRCHMVSASYRSPQLLGLEHEAHERGVSLLCELGLDPGMDLMSAQQIIEQIQGRGGVVERFLSYGGGLPEPSYEGNPLRYCITWNPRNVAMAAEHGAQILRRGRIELIPRHRVFDASWTVDVPGLGAMDAYANRDSVTYRSIHGVEQVKTLVRGTLRYPGFCRLWHLIVDLGLPNEALEVPRLGQRTWAELLAMFLPPGLEGNLRQRCARHLGLETSDQRLDAFEWLGLFSDEAIDVPGNRPADALVALLQRKLPLPEGVRDLVVLHHEFDAVYGADERGANENARKERILSTFIHYGDEAFTGMSKTVGLPAALGARMLLTGQIDRPGLLGPTEPMIFEPILEALAAEGLRFEERVEPLP